MTAPEAEPEPEWAAVADALAAQAPPLTAEQMTRLRLLLTTRLAPDSDAA
jgi:hypothetical protein